MTSAFLPRRARRWKPPAGGGARLAASCLLAALGATSCRPPAPAATPAQPRDAAAAPWLVTIIVDQLAAWIAEERWPRLPPSGGFARLRREGLWVKQLRFAHSCTDTAPGHGALFTGATPRESGIVANDLLTPEGRLVSLILDPRTAIVATGGGAPGRPSSSLAALEVETLADALVAARPDARVMSFSLKDRGALFGGGRRPSLVMWLDTELGAFVTSTAFASSLPDWVVPLAGAQAVTRAREAPWAPLDAAWTAAEAATPDDQAGEGDYGGLGVTFPHRARSAKVGRATPAGDQLVLALGRAAAAAAHAEGPGRPLLLSLSLSSNDYVSHVFGPHSWESWDELHRLDGALAELLDALDRLVGAGGYAVMLSADHGSNPLPEIATAAAPWCRAGAPDKWQRACGTGQRLRAAEVTRALEDAAAHALGPAGTAPGSAGPSGPGPSGPWIAGMSEPLVFLTPRARALAAADRDRLIGALARVLRERFSVADLVDLRALPQVCPPPRDESIAALVCRGARPGGPADLYIVPRPGTFFDTELAPGHGTSHGSPYLYDRAVPLIVRAPGRVPAGVVREIPMEFSTFARSAAALLGVPPPAAAGGAESLATAP